jgi:hypothetical protein
LWIWGLVLSPEVVNVGWRQLLRAFGFNNVFEVNFGHTHTPDRAKANMRA